ncbi:MAG: peptidoglycan DD-metalloendopeptidase family protein [Lachnospiraceae bacterium]|nr:peptidoglycan DD-metalloendopeptidase family protein [Clostridium sp.]MDD6179652.1 peptidoglycan DD-metalloendopeptidase family protein [Clostridium sp.]MDY4821522.1 peptidoglycan DD-metalloendopeptidase family protein [Lachnospiraceae bacterium]
MSKNRHKRKVSHILIYTTDAVDADTKQVRIHPWVLAGVTLIVCCVLGAVIGYAVYEGELWGRIREHDASQNAALIAAQDEKDALQEKIDEQDAKIEMLSITIQDQTQQIAELQAQIAEQSVPTDYPLTGSASMTVITDGDPMVEFTATEGSTVVAAGKGVVTAVEEDEVYGNRVVIDHGNGYVSIYRNKGESQVKAGDEVASGTTLFMVTEDNRQLGYQIKENDVYIDPTTIIAIKG